MAVLAGGLAGFGAHAMAAPHVGVALIAADVTFAVYLVLMVRLTRQSLVGDLRKHAAERDEGLPLILCIALGAVLVSIWAILSVLRNPSGLAEVGLALAAAPLGWSVIHVVMAQHYAHAFYTPDKAGAARAGLTFPGTSTPSLADFWYFSFGIGMTAQVSDVTISTERLRRWVLGHAVGSFFYNTVILALAVNAGVALAG